MAAVGIPSYQGCIASSKVSASKENHVRMRDLIAAEYAKRSIDPSSGITLKRMDNVSFLFSFSNDA